MASIINIEKNSYHDSVTLMSLSSKILSYEGVEQAVVSMATEMNKELLRNIELITDEAEQASENDLIIAVKADSDEIITDVLALINSELNEKKASKGKDRNKVSKTINSALNIMPEANIAVISVPGEYAAREANQALSKGLHVMLFSDNVSLEDERQLKELGRESGLLVMGPDCGTAIINGGGLCFANDVAKGDIGLVAASGTGLQEVSVQIDRLGYGITQAIGTGGRDLHEEIGGIMMIEGLKALAEDENTKVITLISKPPAPSVQKKILQEVKQCEKPVVICFLDGDANEVEAANVPFAPTLIDAAKKSIKLLDPEASFKNDINESANSWVESEREKMSDTPKYIRGLFCGGTLTSEAVSIIRTAIGQIKSNVMKKETEILSNIKESVGHTLLDLGDDQFTRGKPHPMIEPILRNERIIQEAEDEETAVLLLDFELGFGSHDDPVGVTIETLKKAKEIAEKAGRNLPIVAYICGTVKDKQGFSEQEKKLKQLGVYIAESNAEAANVATMLVQ